MEYLFNISIEKKKHPFSFEEFIVLALYIHPKPHKRDFRAIFCYRLLKTKSIYELYWSYRQIFFEDIVNYMFPCVMYFHEKSVHNFV